MPRFPALLRHCLLTAHLASPLAAQTQFQTLPAGFDTTVGNSGSPEPFRTAERQRHHFVYDSGEFASTGPIRIHSIAFRPASNTTSWSAQRYLDLTLGLATAQHHYAAQFYRRDFEENFASVPAELYRGDFALASGSFSGTGPRPWAIVLSSSTGYVYHPGLGRDLILDLRTPSRQGAPNPLGLAIDVQNASVGTLGGSDYLHRTNDLSPFSTIYPLGDVAPIIRLEYSPFTGVNADFHATRTRGFGPLAVHFTDRSFSTHAGGVVTREWDFQNDGIVDATGSSTSFTYTAPGSYSVRLRVRDAGGVSSERIAAQLVVIHAPPTSNAHSAEILHYHFDEVRGTRCFNAASTSFAPSFGAAHVGTWQGPAGRAGFEPQEPGFGCLAAKPSAPDDHVVDTGWPVELSGRWTLAWWQRRVGAHGPNLMRIFSLGGDAEITTGGSAGTSFRFASDSLGSALSNGGADSALGVWTHVALVVDDGAGTAEWRINGLTNQTRTFTPGSFRLRDTRTLQIGGGAATELAYLGAYDLDDVRLYAQAVPITPRGPLVPWRPQVAVNTVYDFGCSSLGGIPRIDGNGPPSLGNVGYAITLSGLPANSSASLIVGFTTHVFGLFPLDLSSVLGAGCALAPFPDFSFPVAAPTGSAIFPSPIPADPLLLGAHSYAQWLSAAPSLALSPGLDLHLR